MLQPVTFAPLCCGCGALVDEDVNQQHNVEVVAGGECESMVHGSRRASREQERIQQDGGRM